MATLITNRLRSLHHNAPFDRGSPAEIGVGGHDRLGPCSALSGSGRELGEINNRNAKSEGFYDSRFAG